MTIEFSVPEIEAARLKNETEFIAAHPDEDSEDEFRFPLTAKHHRMTPYARFLVAGLRNAGALATRK